MIRILVVLVVLGALVVFAADHLFQRVVPGAGRVRTDDMTPVEVTLEPKIGSEGQPLPAPKLRLPKAYLTKRSTWSGGKHAYVDIETGLPDLAPRPAIGPFVRADAPGHDASIRFNAEGMFIDLTAATERGYLGWETPDLKPGAAAKGEIEQPPVYGLRRVFTIPCAADYAVAAQLRESGEVKPCDRTKHAQEKYFLVNESGRAELIMTCTPPWANDSGGCHARFHHRGIQTSVIFRRTQLERWREFIDGAKRLVDRYRIS